MNDAPTSDLTAPSAPGAARRFLSFGFACVLLCGVWLAAMGCSAPPPAPTEPQSLLDESDDEIIESEGFVVDRITTGTLRHRVIADRAIHNATQRYAIMENVVVEFYDPDGVMVNAKLWASTGVMYLDDRPSSNALQNDIDLFGSPEFPVQFRRAVEGSTDRGDTLITPRLRWNDAEVWEETIGVIRGAGPYRQIRFQEEEGSILLFESDDPEGYIKTDRALGRVGFHKSGIRSVNVTEEELREMRPDTNPNAPSYSPRD